MIWICEKQDEQPGEHHEFNIGPRTLGAIKFYGDGAIRSSFACNVQGGKPKTRNLLKRLRGIVHMPQIVEITETELKLRDAAVQMRLAHSDALDEDIVRSCINAFITLARSVTFLMEKESSQNPEVLAWVRVHFHRRRSARLEIVL